MAHPSGVLVPQAGRSAGTLEETAPPPGGSAGAAGPLPARRTMAHASGVLAPQARSVGGPPSGPARMTGAAPLAALETAALQALVPVPAADPAMLIGEWRAAGGLP